ncbi:hypothetical protein HKCCSP123_11475 [Rhodobacterales bacterium HKCCSP123]|nr:hypothetical protein [Rhodobacterales bacterium HKCCSP123]
MSKISALGMVVKRDGPKLAAIRVLRSYSQWLSRRNELPNDIEYLKLKVLDHLLGIHGRAVAHGPLKGMKFAAEGWWGGADLNAKILGIYEKHVLEKICASVTSPSAVFIDIGCADGFFAIGAVYAGIFDKAYAFDIAKEARSQTRLNAEINGLAERVVVESEASTETIKSICYEHDEVFTLIDIEGAEFDYLTDELLDVLNSCKIIIELHPWVTSDDVREAFFQRVSQHFNVSYLAHSPVNIHQFPELERFSDDARCLCLSENRRQLSQHIFLTPK